MYPHARILLAALTFAVALGLLVAAAGYAGALVASSMPPTDPPDNAPIRAAGLIIFALAPAATIASLIAAIPLSYLAYSRRRPRLVWVAVVSVSISVLVLLSVATSGSSLASAVLLSGTAAAVLFVAGSAWWVVIPRSNQRLERP